MPAAERLSGPNRFTQRVIGGTAEDELAGVALLGHYQIGGVGGRAQQPIRYATD